MAAHCYLQFLYSCWYIDRLPMKRLWHLLMSSLSGFPIFYILVLSSSIAIDTSVKQIATGEKLYPCSNSFLIFVHLFSLNFPLPCTFSYFSYPPISDLIIFKNFSGNPITCTLFSFSRTYTYFMLSDSCKKLSQDFCYPFQLHP